MTGPDPLLPFVAPRRPVPGEEFVWLPADPDGGWSDMCFQVADVLGEGPEGGWLIEYGLPGVPPAVGLLTQLPDLKASRTHRTVVDWTGGRWERRADPEDR